MCEALQPGDDGVQALAQPLLLVVVQIGHELCGDLTPLVFHLGHRLIALVGQGDENGPAVLRMWSASHIA